MARCAEGVDAQLQRMARPASCMGRPASCTSSESLDAALEALSDAVAHVETQGRGVLQHRGSHDKVVPGDCVKAPVPMDAASFHMPVDAVMAGAHGESTAEEDAPPSVVMQHLLGMPDTELAAMFGQAQLRTVVLYVLGLQECMEELAQRVQAMELAMTTARCL